MDNNYKSGITGQAFVRFGGKILIQTGQLNDYPGSLVLALSELKKDIGVGNEIPKGTAHYEPQVILAFPDLEALTNFRNQLDIVETSLKEQEERE